ncbi:MAG: SET domain-containing protein [Verrucomicrobiales bacterium]|nr:SET domain-containing protein [Verrucomicrobiales bacterium]
MPGLVLDQSMMLVRVAVGRSDIEGMGLFATVPIPAGTPVWRWVSGFDRVLEESEMTAWPEAARRHIAHYGYLDPASRRWVLGGDLSIFMNHAAHPNTGAPGTVGAAPETVALRDIAAGEELTCDYHQFDASGKPVGC